jgi:transketolase
VCYPNLNVNILAGIGGLSGGIEGATHMALEDLGVVRCLPNLTVFNPADYFSTKSAVIEAAKLDGPTYIRVGRDDTPVIFDENYSLDVGKANMVIDEGDDIGIIVSGIILHYTLKAAKRLKEEGFRVKLMEMPTIKPIDTGAIIDMASKVKHLITIEEHNLTGGLNTAVCEVLSREYPKKVYPIATDDIYGQSGSPQELAALYGLDGDGIYEKLKKIVGTNL